MKSTLTMLIYTSYMMCILAELDNDLENNVSVLAEVVMYDDCGESVVWTPMSSKENILIEISYHRWNDCIDKALYQCSIC